MNSGINNKTKDTNMYSCINRYKNMNIDINQDMNLDMNIDI